MKKNESKWNSSLKHFNLGLTSKGGTESVQIISSLGDTHFVHTEDGVIYTGAACKVVFFPFHYG